MVRCIAWDAADIACGAHPRDVAGLPSLLLAPGSLEAASDRGTPGRSTDCPAPSAGDRGMRDSVVCSISLVARPGLLKVRNCGSPGLRPGGLGSSEVDSEALPALGLPGPGLGLGDHSFSCLLYTSDAADE